MFFATLLRPRQSLALRLTLWYAAIFAAGSVLAFAGAYALIATTIDARGNDELRQDLDEYALHWRQEGLARVTREMQLDTQGDEASKSYFRLWAGDGREIASTDLRAWPELAHDVVRHVPADDGAQTSIETKPRAASAQAPMRRLVGSIGPGVWLEIGRSLEDDRELLREILRGFVAGLAVVLLLGAPIGWFMARRALHGVNAATRTAQQIADGAFERRVPVGPAGDELDQLARTFNAMLDRIQALIIGMRDMADNLAHDLRSPLGRIRACAEMSLGAANHGAASVPEDGAAAGHWAIDTIEECDRLLAMLDTTLDIAEADAGAARLDLARIDLAEIVQAASELFQPLAEDRRIGIVVSASAPCWIVGDRQRLQRVLANLLDNAIKYTPAGGEVRLTLREQAERVLLGIEDNGIGIGAADLPHVFKRFYRCDRSRSGPGIGLGLSLAMAFVRAHGGDISVTSTPGQGSRFAVALPRQAMAPAPRAAGRVLAPVGAS